MKTVLAPRDEKAASTEKRWTEAQLKEALSAFRVGSVTGAYVSAVLDGFEPFNQATRDRLGSLIDASSKVKGNGSDQDRLQIIVNRTMEVIDPFRLMAHQFLQECPLPRWTKPRTSKAIGPYVLPVSDADVVTETWVSAARVIEPEDSFFSTEPPYTSYECCLTIAREVQERRRRYRKVVGLPRLNEQATAVGHVVAAIGFLSVAAERGSPWNAVASLREMESVLPDGRTAALSVALDVIDEMRTGRFHKSHKLSNADCQRWISAGFTKAQAEQWLAADVSLLNAKEYRRAGFRPERDKDWRSHRFDVAEAVAWNAAGFSPNVAFHLKVAQVTLAEAAPHASEILDSVRKWSEVGEPWFTLDWAVRCLDVVTTDLADTIHP